MKRLFNKKSIVLISIVFLIVLVIALILLLGNKKAKIALENDFPDLYEWQYKIEDDSVVKFIKKDKKKEEKMLTIEKFYFKGVKPGKTTIRFYLEHFKNKSYMDAAKYEITVDKNLKVKTKEVQA